MSKEAAKAAWEIDFERELAYADEEESETPEEQIIAGIRERMALGRIRFDQIMSQHIHCKHGSGRFDCIGINEKTVVVGEVVLTLKRADVRHFAADRMEFFKRAFSRHAEGKKVQGVLIYQKARAGAVEEALKLKMKVFRAEDDKTLRAVKTSADIPKRTKTQSHKRR